MDRTRAAFTLIETLVVAGLIAALATLVYAALTPARLRARETACVSNLKQWGAAFAMYRADYDGIDPVAGMETTPAQVGLPSVDGFIQMASQYRLDGREFRFCPMYRRRKIDPPGGNPFTSYAVGLFEDITRPDYGLSLRGVDYPLLSCEFHNDRVDVDELPTWSPRRFIVLRLSGNVAPIVHAARERNGFMW